MPDRIQLKTQDALYNAHLVRTKQISPTELLENTFSNIEKVNPYLNAMVSTRYEKALEEAKKVRLDTLFAGVPIVLKDLGQELAGEKNTAGSRLLQNYVSKHTDLFVQKLQSLGFVVIGQTASCEFGFRNVTQSELFGVTKNPLDLTRHVGGSSGGAASIVASGALPIACASDGGGSIRIPASWTGLMGLKPSRGRVPVGPYQYRGWQGASSHFALTKSLRDTKALLYGLQVEQWESPFILPLLNPQSNKKALTVAFSTQSPYGTPVCQKAKDAVYQAVKKLEQCGCVVEEVTPKVNGELLLEGYYAMNGVETVRLFDTLGATREQVEPMSWLIYEMGKEIKASRYSAILSQWDEANAVMTAFHQQYDVLLTPATAYAAPKIADYAIDDNYVNACLDNIGNMSQQDKESAVAQAFSKGITLTPFTQLANLTGQPAISVPMDTEDTLPIGVHLMSKKGREDILFDACEWLQA